MKCTLQLLILGLLTVLLSSGTTQSKQQIFLQVVDSKGQPIRGTSVQRGHERQLIITSFSGVTTGKNKLQFTISSAGASASFATIQANKEILPYAIFTVTEPAEARLNVLSTIRLEAIRILTVEDANGNTNITLQAARIGTTYFDYNRKTGVRSVSGKTGYDYTSGQTWNSF